MNSCPPDRSSLEGKIAREHESVFNPFGATERMMRDQPVISDGDPKTVPKVRKDED
jgi:hypothetical protein